MHLSYIVHAYGLVLTFLFLSAHSKSISCILFAPYVLGFLPDFVIEGSFMKCGMYLLIPCCPANLLKLFSTYCNATMLIHGPVLIIYPWLALYVFIS